MASSEGSSDESFEVIEDLPNMTGHQIMVEDLPDDLDEEMLTLYFEHQEKSGGGDVEKVEINRKQKYAVVTFQEPAVVISVLTKNHNLNERALHVKEHVEPEFSECSVGLLGVKSDHTQEVLQLYFENQKRSGGGPVRKIKFLPDEKALITFWDPSDACNVAKNSHTVKKCCLAVYQPPSSAYVSPTTDKVSQSTIRYPSSRQDPQTTSNYPPTIRQGLQASAKDLPTSTQETPGTLNDPSTTRQEPPTTSKYPQTTNQEPPTTSEYPPTKSQESQATLNYPPTTSQEPQSTLNDLPTTSQEPQSTLNDLPTTSQVPQTTLNDPPTKSQESQATLNYPPTTNQEPQSTLNDPPTTNQEPQSTLNDPPTSSLELPTTSKYPPNTNQGLQTTSKYPPTTNQYPPTKSQEPQSTLNDPPSTSQVPQTTLNDPPTTSQEPQSTLNDPPTNESQTKAKDQATTCQKQLAAYEDPQATTRYPPTTNKHLQATTRDLKATNEDLQATTRNPTATNTDAQATKRDSPAANEDPQDSTRDQLAANEDPQATTRDKVVANEDSQATTRNPTATKTDAQATKRDSPAANEDPQDSTRDQLAANEDPQATTRDQLAANEDPQATTRDQVVANEDRQATTSYPPAANEDWQATTRDQTAAKPDMQATTRDPLAADEDTQATNRDPPATNKHLQATTRDSQSEAARKEPRIPSSQSIPEGIDTVEVVGLPSGTSLEYITKCMSKYTKSPGDIKVVMDENSGSARVQFKSKQDARTVIEKGVIGIGGKNAAIVQPYIQTARPVMAKSQDRTEYLMERTVKVHGVPPDENLLYLQLFFEDKQKCGGGAVEGIKHTGSLGCYVTFVNAEDAASVILMGNVNYRGMDLKVDWPAPTVEMTSEISDQIRDSSNETEGNMRTIAVSNLPSDVQTNSVESFFSSKRQVGGGSIEFVEIDQDKRQAVICYYDPSDAANVVGHETVLFQYGAVRVGWHSEAKDTSPPSSASAEIEKPSQETTDLPDTIRVNGFKAGEQKDVIMLFFEHKKRSGGGEIAHCEYFPESQQAFITFVNPKDVEGVLERYKQGPLVCNGCELRVLIEESTSLELTSKTYAVGVNNINEATRNDELVRFFENKDCSKGGKILELERVTSSQAVITYKDPEIARQVAQCRPLKLRDSILDVQLMQPQQQPPDPKTTLPLSYTSCLLTDMSDSTEASDIIQYLIVADKTSQVNEVLFGPVSGTAMVNFNGTFDVDAVRTLSAQRPLRGAMITFHRVPVTCAVQVFGVTSQTVQHLGTYFEDEEHGVQVMNVHQATTQSYAIVTFKDFRVIPRIVQKKHAVHGEELHVQPFYERLGVIHPDHDTSVPTMSKFPEPISIDWENKLGLKFVQRTQTFQKQIETKLSERWCKVVWPGMEDSHINLHCTLDPHMLAFHKLCDEWEDSVFDCIQGELTRIKSHRLSTVEEVYRQLKSSVERLINERTIDHEKLLVEMIDDKSLITLAGEAKLVADLALELTALAKTIEDENLTKSVTDTIKDLKPWELTLWRAAKYPEKLKQSFPDMILTIQGLDVKFSGKMSHVTEAKKDLENMIRDMVCEKMVFGELAREILREKASRDYLLKKFPFEVPIVWDSSVKKQDVYVYATTKEDLNKGTQVLRENIKESSIRAEEGCEYLFSSEQWVSLIQLTTDRANQGRVLIKVNEDNSKVNIASTRDLFDGIQDKVIRILKSHTIIEKFLKSSVGIARLCDKAFRPKVKEICQALSVYGIKIYSIIDPKRPGFLIKGSKDGLKQATDDIQKLIDGIKSVNFTVTKPGMSKYFCTKQGKEFLDNMEHRYEVGIEIEDSSICGNESLGDSRYSVTLPKGTKLTTMLYDLTKFPHGAIVNPANKNLIHNRALAKTIVDAGGKKIQDECTAHIKKNGLLKPGDVFLTKPGTLPCSLIMHAVGPRWHGGGAQEEAHLYHLIQKLLTTATCHGVSQIAMPAISTGVLRFPHDKATTIIVKAAVDYFNQNPSSSLREVYMVDVASRMVIAFRDALCSVCGESSVAHVLPHAPLPPDPATEPAVDRASMSFTTPQGVTLTVLTGTLARQQVDMMVNSSNKQLNLEFGYVSKSLLQEAGQELQQECRRNNPGGIKHGEVFVTRGYKLPCKHVAHVACAKWGDRGSQEILERTILGCFAAAADKLAHSIAFPALGTGGLGVPVDNLAQLLVKCVIQYSNKQHNITLQDVTVVLSPHDESLKMAFCQQIEKYHNVQKQSDQGQKLGMYQEETGFRPKTRPRRPSRGDGGLGEVGKAAMGCRIGSLKLDIVQGDITKEKSGAVVNSTNYNLYPGGCVSKALAQQGGSKFQQACEKIKKPVKLVAITEGGDLQCSNVIHLVAPPKPSDWPLAIEACLKTAEEHKLPSISLPALGTGNKAVTAVHMASVILRAIHQFVKDQKPRFLSSVRIVIYNHHMVTEFTQALQRLAEQEADQWSEPVLLDTSSGPHAVPVKTIPLPRPDPKRQTHETAPPKQLVLQVYADDRKKIAPAIQDIHGMCNRQCDEKLIAGERDQSAIARLTPAQMKKLQDQAKVHDVKVTVERKPDINYIQISGCADDVADMYNIVMRELRAVEEEVRKQREQRSKPAPRQATNYPLPKIWTPMKGDHGVALVQLHSGHQEYQHIKRNLMINGTDIKQIIKMERVQNPGLYQRYFACKATIMEKYQAIPSKDLEHILWHKVLSSNQINYINDRGFLKKVSALADGDLGYGVYFTTHPATPIGHPPPSDLKHIYMCRVLIGRSTAGNISLIEPPAINPRQPSVKYDSTSRDGVYAIFHEDQVYPEYLITYQ